MRLITNGVSGDIDEVASRFSREQVIPRLHALVAQANTQGLRSLDPAGDPLVAIGMEIGPEGQVTKSGYGVFELAWLAAEQNTWPERIRTETTEIRQRLAMAHGVELRVIIWAGMGGSAEDKTAYLEMGLLSDGPQLFVLDSTDPAKLNSILELAQRWSDLPLSQLLPRTLVVGMAMGMTSYEPVVNLQALARLYDLHGVPSKTNFIYLTIPDSLLDRFGRQRDYRRVELQLDRGNSTAGRHSAPLTRGALYPLGFAGYDLDRWIAGTHLDSDQIASAFRLAAFMHLNVQRGQNKFAWQLPPAWQGLAIWTKQAFEESLGKSETVGLKIDGSGWGVPPGTKDYAEIVVLDGDLPRTGGDREPSRGPNEGVGSVPVESATIAFGRDAVASTYQQWVHYVVFGLAYLWRMNFVTQPGVELYKSVTNQLFGTTRDKGSFGEDNDAWRRFLGTPNRLSWHNAVHLLYGYLDSPAPAASVSAPEQYARLLASALSAGHADYLEFTYFGDTRYSESGERVLRILRETAQQQIQPATGVLIDLYEGPAMNHSYHEMIIGHGGCFSTVLYSRAAAACPEAGLNGDYHRAQFLATQMALAARKRQVCALLLEDLSPTTLGHLESFLQAAAHRLPGLRSHSSSSHASPA